MRYLRRCASWGLAIAVLLFSPIVVIVTVPLALGVGLDIFDMAGDTGVALALCGPVALVLIATLGRAPIRQLIAARWRAPLQISQPARLDYAP